MIAIHPQFVTDTLGRKRSVLLPIKDFKLMIEELEEIDDVRLYDQAKKEDDGERILLKDYLKKRNIK